MPGHAQRLRPHFEEHRLASASARWVGTRRTEAHVHPSSCATRLPSADGAAFGATRCEELANGALHCLLECPQLTDGERPDRRAGKADSARNADRDVVVPGWESWRPGGWRDATTLTAHTPRGAAVGAAIDGIPAGAVVTHTPQPSGVTDGAAKRAEDAISAPVRRRGRHHRPAAARVVASVNDPPHAVAIEAASDEHVAAPCEFDRAIRVAASDVTGAPTRRPRSQDSKAQQEPDDGEYSLHGSFGRRRAHAGLIGKNRAQAAVAVLTVSERGHVGGQHPPAASL